MRMDSSDLFTGLPTQWRTHSVGHFSNNGQPPIINDGRVTFHTGYVEEKIHNLSQNELEACSLVVLFDLDLYQPTLDAYSYLRRCMKAGDILYFDEAFDIDECAVIKNQVLEDFNVKLLGSTSMALALSITGVKIQDHRS